MRRRFSCHYDLRNNQCVVLNYLPGATVEFFDFMRLLPGTEAKLGRTSPQELKREVEK